MLIVALPTYSGDVELLLKNLRWQVSLCGQQPGMAVISHDPRFSHEIVQTLETAAKEAYKTVTIYAYPQPSRSGWPQGPNWVFQHTARFMEQFRTPWLFMEPDAVPVKADWLQVLEAEYSRCGRKFMGVIVPDWGHLNGVAIYPHDTPKRIPHAMSVIDVAWDTSMAPEMIKDAHAANHLFWHCWGTVNGKVHPWDGPPPMWTTQESLRSIPPGAVLAHRDKCGTLIDRFREQRNGKRLDICTMKHARTDIFIVSYDKDIHWLEYNLKSIRKFCTGFGQTNVLVPTDQHKMFEPLREKYRFTLMHYETPNDPVKHHIAHQLQKCKADLHCPDASFILFTDSDCIFTEPVTPEDYFVDGKPVLLIRPYKLSGGGEMWKPVVDKALGIDSKFETMARHGAIHYRELFSDVRKKIGDAHGGFCDEYVMSCKPDWPYEFSEFNVIGNVCLMPPWKDKYHFIDLEKEPAPKPKLRQFWSYGEIDKEQDLPSGEGRAVPLKEIEKILA